MTSIHANTVSNSTLSMKAERKSDCGTTTGVPPSYQPSNPFFERRIMDSYLLIVFGFLAAIFIALLAIGARNPRSIAEITGKADERRWMTEAAIEEQDVKQMLEARNDSRRRLGKAELSEAEIAVRARSRQRESLARARKAVEGRDAH
jgi:hypothetical protein